MPPETKIDCETKKQQIYRCVAKFRNIGTIGRKAAEHPKKELLRLWQIL
jgi:hypothetical protein